MPTLPSQSSSRRQAFGCAGSRQEGGLTEAQLAEELGPSHKLPQVRDSGIVPAMARLLLLSSNQQIRSASLSALCHQLCYSCNCRP